MLRYVSLVLLLSVYFVMCKHVREGAECEWEGIKGKCVRERRCFTTLDNRSPKQPLCPEHGDEEFICCTDCDIINDVRENPFWRVLHRFLVRGRYNWRNSLPSKLKNRVQNLWGVTYYKDGRKARDNCLHYLITENKCSYDGYYTGIRRRFDKERKCHSYYLYAIGGSPPPNRKPVSKYPHQALLGVGDTPEAALLVAGGAIISDRYILTAARANVNKFGPINVIAVGVLYISRPSTWQTHKVKRFIAHPQYKKSAFLHDIALVQTEATITFNINVLPACLIVEDAKDEEAVVATWTDIENEKNNLMTDTIQTIDLEKSSDDECRENAESFDPTTQLCYGSKTNTTTACWDTLGEPLLIRTQFSHCLFTIIGVTSYGPRSCSPNSSTPHVYTRVSNYVPWIENIVWL